MTQFFKSKNNQNKYFIYLLISKENVDKNFINTKIIITKSLILHDLNYILNNYETIIENELEYKIIEHCVLTYNFNTPEDSSSLVSLNNQNEKEFNKIFKIPMYPYDMFITNRVLLHSFLQIINSKSIKDILFKEKIHIVSNMNYLKRIKDWSPSWKKNRYSIEKYQSSSHDLSRMREEPLSNLGHSTKIRDETLCSAQGACPSTDNNTVSKDSNHEPIFSIQTLSQYYFNIDNHYECKNTFICKPMSYEEKSLFERSSERPNTDLIEICSKYFEEDKQIKFV